VIKLQPRFLQKKKKKAKEGEEKDILSEHLSLAVTLTYI
jgi:hypothetical protein